MNITNITECFSSFSVTFMEDRFCLFRTWSFTLSKNDLDPKRNLIGTRVFLPKWRQRVSPFYHPSIHQLSTLEKTKLCHQSNLSSVLSTSFQQIVVVHWLVICVTTDNGLRRSIIFLSFRTPGTDLHNFFPGLSDAEDDRVVGVLAKRLIVGLNFAVTLSCPESCCVLFDITSEQTVELKWLILNKHNRWFHSSRVKFPLVRMSASWLLVSM